MKRLFLLLLSSMCCLTNHAGRAQDAPAKAPAEFAWEEDSLQAFVKAVEQNKPMVVLFGNLPKFRSPTGTNFTNDIRKEFNTPELIALRERAVFTLGFPDEDEFARRMALHLKLTDYPTISVIAPRTDQLTETYRMEGFFKAGDIFKDLTRALPAPKDAPPAAANEPKKEAAPLSEADQKAIQEAVTAYGAAFKAGDLEQVTRRTAGPFNYFYEQGFALAREVGKAKRGILQAIDQRFGPIPDSITHGADDEKIRAQMRKVQSLFVLEYDTAIGKVVTLQVEATMSDGRKDPWKLVAYRPSEPGGPWLLWPKLAVGLSEIGTNETWQKNMKKLAAGYDAVAADVKAGKFSSRQAVHQAVFEAYSRAMSPSFANPGK
jgi:hypothetical protein